jgi:hypothetical protein
LALPLYVSSLQAQSATAPCTAANLDVAFRFGGYPPSTYTVTVLTTNISTFACTLSPSAAPRFFAANKTIPVSIPIRLDGNHLNPEARPPIILNPNRPAHQTIRWTMSPANGGPACIQPAVLSITVNGDRTHPAEVLAPALLPPICSEISVESYALGPALDDDAEPDPDSTLHLSSARASYLPGEPFSLNAEACTPTTGVTGRATRCPPIFLRERTPDGNTRLQELNPPQASCLNQNAASPAAHPTTFEAAPPIKDTAAADATLQLFQLASPPGDTHISLTESNPITLHITAQDADETANHNR